MEWEEIFRSLKALNWVVLLLLSFISYWLMAQPFTTGIILGGLIVIANFHVLQHTIRQAFPSNRILRAKKGRIILTYFLRLAAMGTLIYVLITRQVVHPVGLTIGLSIVVISIISLGIHMIRKVSSGEAI